MGHHTFYEIARRYIPHVKYDGMYLSWHDSIINVRTDRGMTFFEYSYNLECLDKTIDVLEFALPSPKTSPASGLCNSDFLKKEMPNYEYTEMLIDSSFWPHNESLTQEMTTINMSTWSPEYFLENKSVLAILNNIGGVEIFRQRQCRWERLINLSLCIKNSLQYNKTPKNFQQLKEAVYTVETSAICWASELNSDGSCYFVTAQKNKHILFWQIFANSDPVLKFDIQISMDEIRNMLWIKQSNKLFLICADIMGVLKIINMSMKDGVMNSEETYDLWKHTDRMIGSNINYIEIDKKFVIFYTKHRHFIVQLVDENCNILSEYVNNINDYKIADITEAADGFYIATLNVKIFKININVSENNLSVDLVPVSLKDSYSTYELCSLSFSTNNALTVLAMIDRKLHSRKEVYKFDIIFMAKEAMFETLIPKLLDNPSKRLTKYWDCIESLRYKIIKTNTIPDIDYELLYMEGANDMYKLKIYLILLIIYVNMRKMAWIPKNSLIPEASVEAVKEKILLLHAQSNLNCFHKKHENGGKLSSIEEESLYGSVKYLHYYAKKNKTELVMDDDIYSTQKQHFKYECQSCDEYISDNFTCKNGHLNMFCMLSLTPITSHEYLICRSCGTTSRADLLCKPLCIFCDQLLVKVD